MRMLMSRSLFPLFLCSGWAIAYVYVVTDFLECIYKFRDCMGNRLEVLLAEFGSCIAWISPPPVSLTR